MRPIWTASASATTGGIHPQEGEENRRKGKHGKRGEGRPGPGWFTKNCTISMSCALAPGCKEQILTWISEGKFDTNGLPVEIWPVSKCAEAFEYKMAKGEDVFKIIFDWSK